MSRDASLSEICTSDWRYFCSLPMEVKLGALRISWGGRGFMGGNRGEGGNRGGISVAEAAAHHYHS